MNIAYVNVGLTGNDLISIFTDFVNIKELEIKSVDITDEIIIVGSFTKWVVVNFECRVKLSAMENNNIVADVTKFKVLNIKVASFIRKMVLKFALKSLKDIGISYIDGKVRINYKYLLKDIPYVDFNIGNIYMSDGKINVETSDIEVSFGGELKKEVELFNETKKEEIPENIKVKKVEDKYSSGREVLTNKMPEGVRKFSDYIFVIPDIVVLIYRLLKDKRVSMKTKVIISGAVAYISVPTDIIPDKIPFVGKIDDLAVIIFSLDVILKEVPLNIILDNWQGKNDFILVIKSLIDYATNFTGAKNVETLYKVIDELVSV